VSETISYAYKITQTLIQNRKFRNAILNLLVRIYTNLPNPDYVNVVQCLIYLDEPEQVASILENLIRDNNVLMAYQLGLDLYENANQQFLLKVKTLLKALVTVTQPMEIGATADAEMKDSTATDSAKDATSATSRSEAVVSPDEVKPKVNDEIKANIDRLLTILNGEITIGTNMQFLIKNNHSDLLILRTIKVFINNWAYHQTLHTF
jgi:26S proteasome regulatory subunit N2